MGRLVSELIVAQPNTIGGLDSGARVDRSAFYQGNQRWSKEIGTISLNVSHAETAGVARQRLDFLASLKWKGSGTIRWSRWELITRR